MSIDELVRRGLDEAAGSVVADAGGALPVVVDRGRRRRRRRTVMTGMAAAVVVLALLVVGVGLTRSDRSVKVQTADTRPSDLPAGWSRHTDVGNRVTVDLPPGWNVAPAPLTDQPADPSEILSVGTGPLVFGGHQTCDLPSTPNAAIEAMSARDVLVQLVERRVDPGAGPPDRPDHLGASVIKPWNADGRCFDAPATYYWGAFRDASTGQGDPGREIYAFVAMGNSASLSRQAQVWQVLDRMKFEARSRTREVLEPTASPLGLPRTHQWVRSDEAIDAVPFEAYPWFQISTWSNGGEQ
jgi:hypothetical protein